MNKLMARIFAVVMVVAMLGTVSFAADYTETSSYASGVITTNKDDDAAQAVETVLAFATNNASATAPDTANGDVIIAIEQDTKAPETINIDTNKIKNLNYIIVVFSGTAGTPTYARIDNRDKNVVLETIEIENYTYIAEDGTIYTGVAKAVHSFEADADREVAEYGFRFKKVNGTGAGAELKQTVNAKMSGKVQFSAAIVGVPSDVTLTATPYILYK